LADLWEMNWMEGNSLFTFMTLALGTDGEPKYGGTEERTNQDRLAAVPHAPEALRLAVKTLKRFPVDRVLRPGMNSLRADIELNPFADRFQEKQSAKPLPIDQRPLDNEYEWKGNPYRLDGWLKPTVTAYQVACDDPLVAWFADSTGRVYGTLDGGKSWRD